MPNGTRQMLCRFLLYLGHRAGEFSPAHKKGAKMANLIGTKIKTLLRLRGKKQVELCRALGLSPSRLSNYISGSREPDLETLSKIANYLGKPLDYFNCATECIESEDMEFYLDYLRNKKMVSVDIITEAGIRAVRIPGKALANALIAC